MSDNTAAVPEQADGAPQEKTAKQLEKEAKKLAKLEKLKQKQEKLATVKPNEEKKEVLSTIISQTLFEYCHYSDHEVWLQGYETLHQPGHNICERIPMECVIISAT